MKFILSVLLTLSTLSAYQYDSTLSLDNRYSTMSYCKVVTSRHRYFSVKQMLTHPFGGTLVADGVNVIFVPKELALLGLLLNRTDQTDWRSLVNPKADVITQILFCRTNY